MKRGQVLEGYVDRVEFPNKGKVIVEDLIRNADGLPTGGTEPVEVTVQNVIEGQKVSLAVKKSRKSKAEGRLLEILEASPLENAKPFCQHYGACGGCSYQTLDYEKQLSMKENQVKRLLEPVLGEDTLRKTFEGIKGSPKQFMYRNKMEFSFGDAYKDGPLALGMHKRGSFYDIVTVEECQIVHEDFCKVMMTTVAFFEEKQADFYHKMSHEGYLRHLLVRRGEKTGEILVDLITSSDVRFLVDQKNSSDMNEPQADRESVDRLSETTDSSEERLLDEKLSVLEQNMLAEWKDTLLALNLEGTFAGVLHTRNDREADVVEDQGTTILYGEQFFYEELLGLRFKISPFSFFQTNSLGAEVLYDTARTFIAESGDHVLEGKTVYDLYSGTGTIAQILAPVAEKVIGVEIIEEAVEAAKENAKLNDLINCEFIAGDVLKVIGDITEKPGFIVLDPPRDGIHPKALDMIIDYGVDSMVYISCKPTSLARDLEVLLERGYEVKRVCCVDMFPGTVHVETIVALHRKDT